MNASTRLRRLLVEHPFIVAPGAFDCITAKAVERAGFHALYMTGMGTSISRLGLPDYGLATMTEMVANAAAMAACVETPIIADADTGYGNELNMTRAVREYERAGVAGIHIEDQVFPKKCGHLDKKQVIAQSDYINKIRAAVDARRNPDFVIIARTDSNAVHGFTEAIDRANAALDVGADLALVEAPESRDELSAVPSRVHGPCVLNVLVGGKSPLFPMDAIAAMGYRFVLLSDLLLATTVAACDFALASVYNGTPLIRETVHTPKEVFRRFGSESWDRLRSA